MTNGVITTRLAELTVFVVSIEKLTCFPRTEVTVRKDIREINEYIEPVKIDSSIKFGLSLLFKKTRMRFIFFRLLINNLLPF